mmetsp:Transcript_55892/g.122173  ORF Transcript_55892/g.122173 Transcript_55892/m.122173 type:complete len:225 (+) Transcript_55892:3367-4041(+)
MANALIHSDLELHQSTQVRHVMQVRYVREKFEGVIFHFLAWAVDVFLTLCDDDILQTSRRVQCLPAFDGLHQRRKLVELQVASDHHSIEVGSHKSHGQGCLGTIAEASDVDTIRIKDPLVVLHPSFDDTCEQRCLLRCTLPKSLFHFQARGEQDHPELLCTDGGIGEHESWVSEGDCLVGEPMEVDTYRTWSLGCAFASRRPENDHVLKSWSIIEGEVVEAGCR